MEALLWYLIKVIFASGVMFGYYQLFLKDRTFHHYNRFYLLSVMVISLIVPLIKISYFLIEIKYNKLLIFSDKNFYNLTKALNYDDVYYTALYFIFGLVAVVLFIRLASAVYKILQLKRTYRAEHFDGFNCYRTDLPEAPFSFFSNLFWKNSINLESPVGQQILRHELVHIRQKHSYDRIFSELVCALFWINPFFHFIKKEITLIHEYLADKKAVSHSDTAAFAQMLLASSFSSKGACATSPLFSSNIKKRLIMLKKSPSKHAYFRKILALPALFAVCFIYMVRAENNEIKTLNAQLEKNLNSMKFSHPETNLVAAVASDTIKNKNNGDSPQVLKKSDSLGSLNANKNDHNIAVQGQASHSANEGDRRNSELSLFDNEMAAVGKTFDKLFESDSIKNYRFKLEKNAKELEKKRVILEKMLKSNDFKNKIKQSQDYFKNNTAEFQKKIAEAQKKAKEASAQALDAQELSREIQKKMEDPAFRQRILDAQQKAQMAFREAERSQAIARLKSGSENILMITPKENKKPKIYLDGVEYNGNLNSIDTNNIESVNVVKDDANGKIYIKTKK